MTKQQDILNLEREIVKHKNLYYQGRPEISDFEFDALEDQLKKLDPKNAVLAMVGSDLFQGEKVGHEKKMLSLAKTYDLKDLEKWVDKKPVVSTFKIDGSSCSLVYRKGRLDVAKTRGDGAVGEKVTNKVLFLSSVPKGAPLTEDFEVRGEIFCTEENFIHLREKMKMMGLEVPSSQRNIVAGLLGRKDHIELASYLSFQAFELLSDDLEFDTEKEKFEILNSLGFVTPEYSVNKTTADLNERLLEAKDFIGNGDYLIDGVVFTFNDRSLQEELGETAHHPRYKMAFKFPGDVKQTKINSITWQVSRNGILTPVAEVEPVEVSGATVSRVTLHNYGVVREFNLKSGDEISIIRSGEVIPKFLEVIKESKEEINLPKNCPSCNSKVRVDDIRIICDNKNCPAQVLEGILNFVKKIGIDDLSSKRLSEMIRAGLVTRPSDLYTLKIEDLLVLDKVKEKLATKIIKNIEKSKHTSLPVFLSALGIKGGALNKSEKVVQGGFDTIEKILEMKSEDLQQLESFAEKSAIDFTESIKEKKDEITELLQAGFEFQKLAKQEGKLQGLKFCITGTLTMKRSELQKMIKDSGGEAVGSVSSKTNYLITNDKESSSSKFKKAKELNIPIINEEMFLEMI